MKGKWLWVVLTTVGLGCMQEDPEIGSEFFSEVSFEIISWDTLSVKMFTVALDSVPANSGTRLLIGQVNHQDLDTIISESYFQLGPDLDYSFVGDHIEFDEAHLVLSYDGYYYGDTLSTLELEVREVAEEMELDDDFKIYSSDSYAVKPEVIGSYEFEPRPSSPDSIDISLKESFSSKLFEYLYNEQVSVEDFLDFLYGLKISSASGEAVVGFTPTAQLRIKYLDKSESPSVERELNITIQTDHIQFNQITGVKSDELFGGLDEEVVLSSYSENKTYVQSGTGLATRLEFPYLENLLSADEVPVIDEVRLELVFENNIPTEVSMLDGTLTLSKVDKNNEVLWIYSTVPELVVDFEFKEDRKIVIDIKDFVQEQLSINTPENSDALLIKFSDGIYQSSVDHLILSDQDGDRNTKIIINELKIK